MEQNMKFQFDNKKKNCSKTAYQMLTVSLKTAEGLLLNLEFNNFLEICFSILFCNQYS